jgi:hypothetical protein
MLPRYILGLFLLIRASTIGSDWLAPAQCPGWCAEFHCDGSAWCANGAVPAPCSVCLAAVPAATPSAAAEPTPSAWDVHEAKNCWWGGHGSDEVDSPDGSSVPGVYTVEACKASCLEYEGGRTCDGIMFEASTQRCFRKSNINPARCSPDPSYVLYLRASSSPAKPSHKIKPPSGKQLSAQERVEALNRRFRDGRPSDDLASSGVLVRQFDTLDDASKKWLPCPPEGNNNWCMQFSDRWPTSIINANQLALYYGPGKGGLIIAPTVELFCAYPSDGNSMEKVCDPLFGDGETCIPGCYPKGQECHGDVTWTCSYPPERLRDALQAQADRIDYQNRNNELVVDVRTVVSQLPEAIEGFFFIGDRTEPEETRRKFLTEYGMTDENGPPLVELVLSHDGGFRLA